MYGSNDAASGEFKISRSVDLVSCLKTWFRYELFDINPVQERRVLGTSSLVFTEKVSLTIALMRLLVQRMRRLGRFRSRSSAISKALTAYQKASQYSTKALQRSIFYSTLKESRGSLLLAEYCRVFARLSISSMNTHTKVPLS